MRMSTSRLHLEALESRTLPAHTVALGVMGDSLSARYAPGTGPDIPGLLWVEQLEALRSNKITIENQAIAGATSSDLIAQGQHTALATLAARGAIDYAVLAIGTVDAVFQFGPTILAGNPTPFVTTVVTNVQTALNTVAAAGDVHLVVSNIPDVGAIPFFQFQVGGNPVLLERMTAAVMEANQQIEAFAALRDIPVIDLFALSRLAGGPVTMGGVQVANLFNTDGFHPNTVGQGLIANTVLHALHEAGDLNTKHLRLSDQEILDLAGIAHATRGPRTYFDVSGFVLSDWDGGNGRGCGNRKRPAFNPPISAPNQLLFHARTTFDIGVDYQGQLKGVLSRVNGGAGQNIGGQIREIAIDE